MYAPYAKIKGEAMIARAFAPSFPLGSGGARTPGLIAEAGASNLPLPTLVRDQMLKVVEAGHGDDDMSATFMALWPSPRHRRLPERLHAGRRARPSRTATRSPTGSTRSPPPATTTSSSPRATGIPPTTTRSPSRAGRGPCTASRAREGAQLHPALDQLPIDVIVDKGQAVDTDGYSGFEGTDLESLLRERGITQVTVVGLATDYCVKNTALDALRAGFQVTVDSTAVRGVEVEAGDSERALAEVRAAGGVMA